MKAVFPLVACLLVGCTDEPAARTLRIVTGLETDAFSADPPVAKVRIEARTAEGETFAAETTPGGSFDLGDVPADVPLSIDVTGTTAEGVVAVRGRSLGGIVPGALASTEFSVFVQRVGAWARPPGALERAHVDAPATVINERFLASTGGAKAADAKGAADVKFGDFYDLLSWSGAVSPDLMPRAARSLLGRFDGMLVVDDAGASWVEPGAEPYDAPLPSGLASYADVAGGRVIESPSGTSYLVGATRAAGPTKMVLVVGSTGELSVATLNQARQGAAAAWAPNVGLVVVGGSATGPGIEVLTEGQTSFVARDLPTEATEGAAVVVAGEGRMALIGGSAADGSAAPTRTWSSTCTSGCVTKEIAGALLPLRLTRTSAFSLGGSRLIVVGQEPDGSQLMRVFEVDLDVPSVEERPLREPRSGAAVLPAPNGTLAIIGGVLPDGAPALHVETFFP